MSLFLTALCVRLMVGWSMMPAGNRSRRQLLLIVYLTGLSIGVHQLNLLVIPALALILLFRRRQQPAGLLRIITAILLGCAAVGMILLGMMPGVLRIASQIELYCVNALHLPYHSGVWIFWGLALAIFWALPLCVPPRKGRLELLAWIPALLLTGYSSYMLILVRGAAEPPMNEGAPTNIFALQSYLGRDQYGSTPLFYGRTPYSRILRLEEIRPDGTPDYSRNALEDVAPLYAPTDSGYVLYAHTRKAIYTPELNMFFPRLTSADPADIKAYADWAGMDSSSMTEVEVSFALDSLRNPVGKLLADGSRVKDKELRPTYIHQIRYLFGYQIGYMYFRYLLWNFSGKQNDRFSTGEVEHGNFITGLPAADSLMLGDQSLLPDEIGSDNPGHNVYFMIPLIMGIIGIVCLQRAGRRGRRWNLVLTVLFLMTGVAIVVYLNQSPGEPRERDYSFLGSFWTFAIWIGVAMARLIGIAQRSRARRLLSPLAIAFTILLPVWMLFQNYDDHDRSGRTAVTDFAANLLESLEPDAILFTNGDNFTFPLWWAQEVAGIRRDIRIVNLAYLTTPWYIRQLRIDNPESKGLIMQIPLDELALGGFRYNPIAPHPAGMDTPDPAAAADALSALRDFYASGKDDRALPPVLRIANPIEGDSVYIFTSDMASGSRRLLLRQLAILDILASNSGKNHRPVYWQSSVSSADYGAFRPYTARTLYTRRLTYRDSLGNPRSDSLARHFLDHDFSKALTARSGRLPAGTILSGINGKPRSGYAANKGRGKDCHVYADDTYGYMVSAQRQSLLRLGGRLLKAARYGDALRLALLIDSLYPPTIREYRIYAETDSLIDEGADLGRLYLEAALANQNNPSNPVHAESAAPITPDSAYRKGMALLRRERARYLQWYTFRRSLPPRLQRVLSPGNLRKTNRIHHLDSLINHYSK